MVGHHQNKRAILMVHGAYGSGWGYKKVAEILMAQGFTQLYRHSLTGLGERGHLLNPDIDLNTHAKDVVALANWEDLDDFVLVGHSYGGAVVTVAAEQLDGRLHSMVFLDATLPTAGKSMLDHWSPALRAHFEKTLADNGGSYLPVASNPALKGNEVEDKHRSEQPFKTFSTKIMSTAVRDKHPRKYYVRATVFESLELDAVVHRIRGKPGWEISEIPTGHQVMQLEPQAVADLIIKAAT